MSSEQTTTTDRLSENIHSGHRQRMLEKFLASGEKFPEHEILEILLYPVIKRGDTNEIAHKLIRRFGSLEKVLEADSESLTAVTGVGKRAAAELKAVWYAVCAVKSVKKPVKRKFSFANNKEDIITDFANCADEKFLIYFLNDRYELTNKLLYESRLTQSVAADIPEIAKSMAVCKPTFAIMAHNHPSGLCMPSEDDDKTTVKMNLLCSVHGVTLIDHVIVSGEKTYSYFTDGRLYHIRDLCSLDNVLIKENNIHE